jgi:hypothetical protein
MALKTPPVILKLSFTIKLSFTVKSLPTVKFFCIPTPPATCNAPVVEFVEFIGDGIFI